MRSFGFQFLGLLSLAQEYLFVCWQLLQGCSLRGQPLPPQRSERLRLLKRISPGWCGANVGKPSRRWFFPVLERAEPMEKSSALR